MSAKGTLNQDVELNHTVLRAVENIYNNQQH